MTSKTRLRLGWFAASFLAVVLAMLPASLRADIRIVTWNISDYDGNNVSAADLRNVLFGTFSGRSMNPDIIIVQEFKSQTAVTKFLQALNTDPLNPTEWKAAPFVDGPDTESEFFYRDSKFIFLAGTTVAQGSTTANATTQPRNTYRYDVQLKGYPNNPPVLACYAVHMKASSDSESQARRLVEATRIRTNAQSLPSTWYFLMAGDTNIQSASQAAYQKLVGSEANNAGRFFDPIHPFGSTSPNWNNNSAYRFIHTQDPSNTRDSNGNLIYGGMDDRLDMILLSMNMYNGEGLRYKGNPAVKFSTTTWDDPSHSTRAWGNDGTSYNNSLTTTGNAMVGASIAQSIINAAGPTGHIPVFLDLSTPASATATLSGNLTLQQVSNRAQPLNFVFTPISGTAFSRSVTPAANGDYSVTDLPLANYSVGIKGDKWLRRVHSIDATNPSGTVLNTTLLGGDANNDNAIDVADLLAVINHYNQTQASNPNNFLEGADFNCDGANDVADLLIVIGNYNLVGD